MGKRQKKFKVPKRSKHTGIFFAFLLFFLHNTCPFFEICYAIMLLYFFFAVFLKFVFLMALTLL